MKISEESQKRSDSIIQKLVFSNQIHETRIHKVTKEDCGKVMKDMDGLATNEQGFRFIQDMQIVCLLFFMIR